MSPLLDVRGLSVTLPTAAGPLAAVRGVHLSLAAGETLGIVGESGCGKSMTALSLLGLLPQGAGLGMDAFVFEGEDVLAGGRSRMERLRGARIGMIFQEPMTALNPVFSIGSQLVAVHRQHKRGGAAAARARAVQLLERVGIPDAARRMGQYPHQLSGGLRQRVMIAMALMCGPSLIIADEPTTALDATIEVQILRLLKNLQAEFGAGLVLITHDLDVVARVADRIAVMYAGEIVETGPAAAVLSAPRHPYTRGLLGSVPRPGAAGGRLATIPGVVPSLVDPPQACAFADRCPRVLTPCRATRPALLPDGETGAGRALRCLNPVPVDAAAA